MHGSFLSRDLHAAYSDFPSVRGSLGGARPEGIFTGKATEQGQGALAEQAKRIITGEEKEAEKTQAQFDPGDPDTHKRLS